jgi:hypothetical protein
VNFSKKRLESHGGEPGFPGIRGRFNTKLGELDEPLRSSRECALRKREVCHADNETAIDHAAELRLPQAQAMLDLFEADRQRAAVTLEELREWANAQNQGHLQFRVNQYLEYESVIRRMACRARPASPRIPPS